MKFYIDNINININGTADDDADGSYGIPVDDDQLEKLDLLIDELVDSELFYQGVDVLAYIQEFFDIVFNE